MSDLYGRDPVVGDWQRPHGGHHAAMYGPDHGRWGARCRTCGWRARTSATRQDVRDALDAHLLFHHSTGSYLCGAAQCSTDKRIRIIREQRGLPPRIVRRPHRDPLRYLGGPA